MGQIVSSITDLQLPKGAYVLVLPGWYPTWINPMPGDFNQRHVKAAGLYKPQVVLYIGKDTTNTLTTVQVQFHQLNENVAEILVLYPLEKLKAWDVIQSNVTYIKLLYKFAEQIKGRWGMPLLLHSYIVLRGGLSGWLLGKHWKLPYILSENWTIYYPADPGYLLKRNIVFRYLVKRIFKSVNRFLPVTKNLDMQVQQLVGNVKSTIVPNVVETGNFFYTEEKKNADPFQFIHISTMVYQKNPEGLLRAFHAFNLQMPGNKLLMAGPYPDAVFKYAKSLGLNDSTIAFTGTVTYIEVAKLLQLSSALVLFSRYENLPCVILESLCCGVPVISTSVGGVDEVVNVSNGILVESENEEMLTKAFLKMRNDYALFDRKKIAETSVECFSYAAVGSQINRVYDEVAYS